MNIHKFSVIEWLKEPDSIGAYIGITVVTILALYGFCKLCQAVFNYSKHYDEHHKNRWGH